MKKTIYLLSFLFALSLTINLNAQTDKTGITAAQALKISVGPRAISMGGAFTAISDDITSLYWNPAGSANIVSNEAFFNHSSLYADIRHDYAAFASNLGDIGTVGVFAALLSMDEMLVRTIEKPEGTGEYFGYSSLVIGLNYSRYLTDNFSIGFNVKYITENLWHMGAAGMAIDIGTLYKIPVLNELRIAASISNFGTKMQLSGRDGTIVYPSGAGGANLINANIELDKFDLPLLFRFGLSSDLVKMKESRLTLAIDAVHPNDQNEYLNTGIEYAWNEIVYVRAGYNTLFEKDSERGLTFGFGLHYRVIDMLKVKLDYAYQDFGRLKDIHYFSMGVTF
ncbi:MAG: PorV/PorQ family protein [Ignavibacteriaceae bacterium]|nr:PorV/PorQ family protein [Ignavibacteriaceae bacterium]